MIAKDIAFVLKKIRFRETSLIVHLYARRHGRMSGILKGFYTAKKEFTSPCEVFSLNQIVFYPKKSDIWLVSYIDVISNYPRSRSNYEKNLCAFTITRVIDKTIMPGDRNLDVFTLLKDSFFYLENHNQDKILFIFLIKYLTLSGVRPQLSECVLCSNYFEESGFFSVSGGGLICRECGSAKPDIYKISEESAYFINYIHNNDFPVLLRIEPSLNCYQEMWYILGRFLEHHLDFSLDRNRSLKKV